MKPIFETRAVKGIFMTPAEIEAAESTNPNLPGLLHYANILGGMVYSGVSMGYAKDEKGNWAPHQERRYVKADLSTKVIDNPKLEKPTVPLN